MKYMRSVLPPVFVGVPRRTPLTHWTIPDPAPGAGITVGGVIDDQRRLPGAWRMRSSGAGLWSGGRSTVAPDY